MSTTETTPKAVQAPTAPPRTVAGRGPSYPSLDIQEAIERARTFYTAERRNAAPVAAAARHWGYSGKSSSVRVIVAALVTYGLLEDSGSNDARTLKITDRGLDILLDAEDSPKRLAAVQAAVRAPKSNADLFAKHSPDDLPSDQTLRYYLIREKGFNDGAVDGYLKTLRDSIAYAKLDKPAIIPTPKSDQKIPKPEDESPEVGDVVQWESAGVIRMEAPRRVRAKIEDQGVWWVFVEGSETGIPMEEAVVIEKAKQQGQPPTMPLEAVVKATSKLTADLTTGEQHVAGGKFGKGMTYRLMATGGEVGPKELGKIIKLLEAYKEALDDDDDGLDPRT